MPQRRNITGWCRCGRGPNRLGQRTCKLCHAERQKEERRVKRARDFRAGWLAARTYPEADYAAALADHLGEDAAAALPERAREGPPANQMALFEDEGPGGRLFTLRPERTPEPEPPPKPKRPKPFLDFLKR